MRCVMLWTICFCAIGCGGASQVEVANPAKTELEAKKADDQQKVKVARFQAWELTEACEAFAKHHNRVYPQKLTDLLNDDGIGGPYLRKKSALIDPWGKVFQYDLTGKRHAAAGFTILVPDIITTGPDGQEIGNWQYQVIAGIVARIWGFS